MRTIERLSTKNCAALGTRSFNFTQGFNIVRGANEAGKSTVLEAIAVAFFGSSAMRGSWEDLVTTGEKVGNLSIDLRFGEFTIHRAKSSASVVSDDGQVKISGHGEVTDFFLDLFGLKKGTENHIMIAKQGEIQGILESGASDATRFIENLAGFDQIDALVAQMKVMHPVTDKQALEQQLLSLETKLEEKLSEEMPDIKKDKADLEKINKAMVAAVSAVTAQQIKLDEKAVELAELKEQLAAYKMCAAEVKSQKQFIADLEMNRTGLIKTVSLIEAEADTSQGRLQSAEAFLSGLAAKQTAYQNYLKIKNFVGCTYTWDEELQSLYAEMEQTRVTIKETAAGIKAAEKRITQLESTSPTSEQLKKLEAQKEDLSRQQAVLKAMNGESEEERNLQSLLNSNITSQSVAKSKLMLEDSCPTCGTDLSTKAAEINEATEKEIHALEQGEREIKKQLAAATERRIDARSRQEKELAREYRATIKNIDKVAEALQITINKEKESLIADKEKKEAEMVEATDNLSAMTIIRDTQIKVERILKEVGEVEVNVDRSVYPWTMSWVDDVPEQPSQQKIDSANLDIVYCRGLVTSLKEKREQFDKVCHDITFAKSGLIQLQEQLDEQMDTSEDIETAIVEISAVKEALRVLEEARDVAVEQRNTAMNKLSLDQQTMASFHKAVEEIEGDIKAVTDTILASAENNSLHRAVAEARGVVIESVWNKLFAVTNECFSHIRGEASDIVRDGKVFKVNGVKTVRLSGSTLDSLGLAMRAAIRDIFAPTTNFILLDEICAGMDPDRTVAAMAQVATLNVGQKILVTHEEVSDGLADNIIEV